MVTPALAPGLSVMLTGGTGAFGAAFARHILDYYQPRRVILYSRDEVKHHRALSALGNDPRLRSFVGDVRDIGRLRGAMRGVDVVVHAAAMKRVPECEANPSEAIATNIMGTIHAVTAAIDAGVGRFVSLSTDKSAAPSSLYGATKFVAERYVSAANSYAAGTPTILAATRYGNVVGSTGSVIPVWRAAKSAGLPLQLTDPAMTRFWMTMDEAVQLVLTALSGMQGGEVFIPKLPSVRMVDVARAFRHPVEVTGRRPGEKLHEALVTPEEAHRLYDTGTGYVLYPEATPWRDTPLHRAGVPVPAGFAYTSDVSECWTTEAEIMGAIE